MKSNTIYAIKEELESAREKYGPFNSTHEAYAVLQEEVNEFWELVQGVVKFSDDDWKNDRMREELKQVAAIAIRIIEELENKEIKWV